VTTYFLHSPEPLLVRPTHSNLGVPPYPFTLKFLPRLAVHILPALGRPLLQALSTRMLYRFLRLASLSR